MRQLVTQFGAGSPAASRDASATRKEAPPRRFIPGSTYIITGGTLYKQHLFNSGRSLRVFETLLFETAKSFGWALEAWALLSELTMPGARPRTSPMIGRRLYHPMFLLLQRISRTDVVE